MTTKNPSAAGIAARVRSLASERGIYSPAGRCKTESIEAIAERLAHDLRPNYTEGDLVTALHRLAAQHSQHFRSLQQATEDLRKERLKRLQPQKPVASEPVRQLLAGMSPEDRLRFANGEILPQFVTEHNDDE
jgi:hypothetical protein